jgi:hypothetical protein
VYLGFGFVSDWEYGDLLDFVVIIVWYFTSLLFWNLYPS